jgi:hypothetical protein
MDDNVGLAFGLTFGAGLATSVGACLPFCINLNRPLVRVERDEKRKETFPR